MSTDQPPDELTMVVGAKEIYDKVVAVETKITTLLSHDLVSRVAALEKWRWGVIGAVAASGGALYAQVRGVA